MGKTDSNEPFLEANGMPVFEWFAKNPETAGRPFNQAMNVITQGLEDRIANSYDWKQFQGKTIVDAGGSHGHVVGAIKKAFPDIHCVNLDLPEVINTIPEESKSEGVEYIVGDIFDPGTFPTDCDAIFMKKILHDWSDENCVKILQSCHQALSSDDGIVVIGDSIVPSAKEAQNNLEKSGAASTFTGDMIMMMISGKERTKEQWETLADAGGFVLADITIPPQPAPPLITLKKK